TRNYPQIKLKIKVTTYLFSFNTTFIPIIMKQHLLTSIAAAAVLAGFGLEAEAAPRLQRDQSEPWSRMRKATPAHQWSMPTDNKGALRRVAPDHTLPQSDTFQYLYGPDGSEWYATCDYDIETVELEGRVRDAGSSERIHVYDL
ncbi:MAG: hypothetical protein NC311_19055, partial [Muribaculaceae bacterium]|nr:hypothetical protein [Muribaculaceae bacterium]